MSVTNIVRNAIMKRAKRAEPLTVAAHIDVVIAVTNGQRGCRDASVNMWLSEEETSSPQRRIGGNDG